MQDFFQDCALLSHTVSCTMNEHSLYNFFNAKINQICVYLTLKENTDCKTYFFIEMTFIKKLKRWQMLPVDVVCKSRSKWILAHYLAYKLHYNRVCHWAKCLARFQCFLEVEHHICFITYMYWASSQIFWSILLKLIQWRRGNEKWGWETLQIKHNYKVRRAICSPPTYS